MEHVVMKFGTNKVLDDVNLRIETGEFIAILGPSGCGKTTLLRLLAGFHKPVDGKIYMDGTLAASKEYLLPPNMRNIGMVFQSYALWPHMSVYQNIEFPIQNSKFASSQMKSAKARRVTELIDLVGLSGMETRLPGQLSGGQRQRVALARSMAIEPALLLMDEPLSNLDTALRVEMRREIKQLHENTKATILYVTHDQTEALALADRIAVMDHGKIIQIGTPNEVYLHPETPFIAKFVGASNLIPGRWERDFFYPDGADCKWESRVVKPVFRMEGLFPVKPEQFHITADQQGLSAVVREVEYQGTESRIMMELLSGVQIEVQHRDQVFFKKGDVVSLTLSPLLL